ncbi:beta-glucosidase [Nocardioides marinisabuli]|uniref:Beta-glucosidase n=1 Tax=Nocardioides marinisabuli TaxID=419476 RepID=A0A7Y9F230_9ACTN|nr:GH1 family beta-glucosidase [Nocardioides marinisabuli]NYD58198.1 beta-glucosidase [Nocardioides marinisabuli]
MTTPAPRPTPTTFPADFVWGAATAAFQIEGATDEDGRTDSTWDAFCRVPGAVIGGDTGERACDHYHRLEEDVALMASLNLDAYRFSVAWPRVRPDGGPLNPAGLAFYDRLVDRLLERGILPWVTLYHWDLPQALELRGGWTDRDTVHRFTEYAVSVHEALSDRVDLWTTLNEPWCSAFLGYTGGQHAPGHQDEASGLVAAHHLLLAHGAATGEIRRRQPDARLGITLNLSPVTALDPQEPADRDAARRIDGFQNRVFLDPLLRGSYPEDLLADTAHLGWQDAVRDGDLATIAAPIDVLGINYYTSAHVSGRPDAGAPAPAAAVPARPTRSPYPVSDDIAFLGRDLPTTAMGWEVQPSGLRDLLVRLRDDYAGLPRLYITENGAAYDDRRDGDGEVRDADRIAYVDAHLRALHEAMEAGVDVGGYFVWSLLDNFEWAYGYDKRFGIVHVDYDTFERTPKASARWYAGIAATGTLPRG